MRPSLHLTKMNKQL